MSIPLIFTKHQQQPTHALRSISDHTQISYELVQATRRNELRQARSILSRYTEDEIKQLVNQCDTATGFTPLHNAIIKGHRNMTLYLLDNKANPNLLDNRGWSPLHWAIHAGHTELLCHLLRYKANLDLSHNSIGYTEFAHRQRLDICEQATLTVNPVHLTKINQVLQHVYVTNDYSRLQEIYLHIHTSMSEADRRRWVMLDVFKNIDEAIAFAEKCITSDPLPGTNANATAMIESDEEDDGISSDDDDDDDNDDRNGNNNENELDDDDLSDDI